MPLEARRFCCLRVCNRFFAVCSVFCQPVPWAPTRCRHDSKSVSHVQLTARLKKRALCCVCARTTTSELHWTLHPHPAHVSQSASMRGECVCVHLCVYLFVHRYLFMCILMFVQSNPVDSWFNFVYSGVMHCQRECCVCCVYS